MEKEVYTFELIEIMKKQRINLIDVRDNYIYSRGTIKDAINIPINLLIAQPNKYLKKQERYYIFCNYGTSSKMVCSYLINKGYDVINIIGGYCSYLEDSI